ncbi:MAG: MerR family transcriptional regulator [Chitinophagales bacterium]
MTRYSIYDLEKLSGIKSHTIRIWEKRYGILKPLRTNTNIRYYSNDDLKRILNISVLSQSGIKISVISKLSEQQIHLEIVRLLGKTDHEPVVYKTYMHFMQAAALQYDENEFEKNWIKCVKHLNLHITMTRVIYPLLKSVGLMWSVDQMNPAQEHFLSCLIEKKLMVATNELGCPNEKKGKYLLFLHEEEDHSIPLLFSNYVLRSHGFKTIYLGSRVPLINLVEVITSTNPSHLLTFFITKQPHEFFAEYLSKVKRISFSKTILIGGNPGYVSDLRLSPMIKCIDSIVEFEKYLIKDTQKPVKQKIKKLHAG